jgi:molybdate transport system substrate-binding protein
MVIEFISAVNLAVTGCAAEDSLHVYCGAGLSEPMEEIADLFEVVEGAQIDYTFSGAAQLLTQIVLCKLSV